MTIIRGNMVYGKVLKYTQLFFLWAMHFGKRTLKTEKNYWNQMY